LAAIVIGLIDAVQGVKQVHSQSYFGFNMREKLTLPKIELPAQLKEQLIQKLQKYMSRELDVDLG
jgi:hypothetical protein